MSAVAFVQSLLETGRVKVPPDETLPADLDEAVALLDASARPELAHDPPPLSRQAAAWALTVLYRACRALVFREIDAKTVAQHLSRPCPLPPSPSVCYSADLSLRYLPDVLALARGIAPDDPLVAGLLALARAWPLSSVGVADPGDIDPSPFLADPSLLQLYVDRIIERSDASRLGHALVREATRAALGAIPSLAAAVSDGGIPE
jgi:hypothetical protein